jgi:5-methylcytosine-specific restriction enzyme subunit McrC
VIVSLTAWTPADVTLSIEQARAIELSGIADVTPTSQADQWRVRPGSKVGIVVGDGWEVRVRPRIPIPRLVFLLAYARDPRGWRNTVTRFDPADELFSAIASGFSHHVAYALERGALRGYVRRDERRHDIRGRIRFSDHLARGGGLPLPVEVSYDDFTADILENRMLLTAATLVLRLPRIPLAARMRLRRVRAVLDEVAPLTSWRGLEAPTTTRLNVRYAPALALAELILAGSSLGTEHGEKSSTSFVFDMNKVFEEFVSTALAEALGSHTGDLREQVADRSLDEGGRLTLKPDLSWWYGNRCLSILDAKYKEIDEGLMKHADAYQMLAYCTAFGIKRGYLVYAKDSGAEAASHLVRNADIEIVVETLDVGKHPDALLSDVAALAGRVAGGLPRPLRESPALRESSR